MPERAVCPRCGVIVLSDAPQGLCPACLMGFALGDEPDGPRPEGVVDPTGPGPSWAVVETIADGAVATAPPATVREPADGAETSGSTAGRTATRHPASSATSAITN
jgi:hypothetical protein